MRDTNVVKKMTSNRKFGNAPLRPCGMSDEEFKEFGAKGAPIPFDPKAKLEGDTLYNSSNVGLVKRKTYPNENIRLPDVGTVTKSSPRRTTRVPKREEPITIPMNAAVVASMVKTTTPKRRVVKK